VEYVPYLRKCGRPTHPVFALSDLVDAELFGAGALRDLSLHFVLNPQWLRLVR